MSRTSLRALLCLIAVAALTACASPPSRFYTLSPIREAPPATPSSASVAVGPVSLPESLDRAEMVVQLDSNQVALDEFNRWASPLQTEIQLVLIENLVHLLGTSSVFRYPQGSAGASDFRVRIDVLRFESVPGEAAFLDVLWTVRGKNEKDRKTGRFTRREAVTDSSYDALAAAHSRALGTLSRELAETIRTMENGQ